MRRTTSFALFLTAAALGLALAGCGGDGSGLGGGPTTSPPPPPGETTTTPTVTGTLVHFARDLEGRWSGIVGRSDSGTDYVLTLTWTESPENAPGSAEIQALDCVGNVPYIRPEGDRFFFTLDWEPGVCGDGTFSLLPTAPDTLAYHFEDGRGGISETTMTRG